MAARTAWASKNEQAYWVSALTNSTLINILTIDKARNSQSMNNLVERLAEARFNIPEGRLSTSFMPVYNPQDKSQWPELLGWLVTVGEMTEVELIGCEYCGSTREGVEDAARVMGISDPICCEVAL